MIKACAYSFSDKFLNRDCEYNWNLLLNCFVVIINFKSMNIHQEPQDKSKKEIGNYTFGKTLGQGTFGKVKLAIHKPTGEQVAIKILEKQKIIDVADVERVSRQIHILKLIRHPNIIQLYEIIETPKYLFLVMEFVENGELFDYIVKHKKIAEREACKLFHQLLNGIQYIHRLNIVHRDLKPQNLLLDSNKSLKLVDFGLSNTYKDNQTLKTPCGSPCYAAPEMIKGQRYEGLKVDVWSSGVILFAMVCGCLPFEDPNTANLYKKILSGKYTPSRSLSNQGRDLLSKILEIDPKKRYTIEQIRQHKWMSQLKDITNNGIIVGFNRIPIEPVMNEQLRRINYDFEYVSKCLQANRHNNATTAYYLLFKKYIRNGGISTCDMASDNFDKTLIEPIKRIDKIKNSNYLVDDLLETAKQNQKSRQNSVAAKDGDLNHKRSNQNKLKLQQQIQSRGRSKESLTPANRISKRYRQQFNKSLVSRSNQRTMKSKKKNDRDRLISNISIKTGKQIMSAVHSLSKDPNRSELAEMTNIMEEFNISRTINHHKRGKSSHNSINKRIHINQSLNGSRQGDVFFKRPRA